SGCRVRCDYRVRCAGARTHGLRIAQRATSRAPARWPVDYHVPTQQDLGGRMIAPSQVPRLPPAPVQQIRAAAPSTSHRVPAANRRLRNPIGSPARFVEDGAIAAAWPLSFCFLSLRGRSPRLTPVEIPEARVDGRYVLTLHWNSPPASVRPHRLARPRTSPFHGGNGGSNPPGDAKLSPFFLPGL